MNLGEFLEWESEQPLPFEYVNGQTLPLPPSSQARSLMVTEIIAIAKRLTRMSQLRVLTRMRISLPQLQEVRYPDVTVDAGPFVAHALEPLCPVLVIDVGRQRDWTGLPEVKYLEFKSSDDLYGVELRVRAALPLRSRVRF